jgi:hypothetical protein
MSAAQRIAATLLLLSLFSLPALAQTVRGPSTPEEREKAVKVTKQLETDPLSATAQDDRKWLVKWIQDVPDITVNICPAILPRVAESTRKFGHEIWLQTMFGEAAYIIQHPNNTDEDAPYVAGVESALSMYQNLLKVRPEARWGSLDELIDKQKDGTLDRYIRDIVSKECSPEREPA